MLALSLEQAGDRASPAIQGGHSTDSDSEDERRPPSHRVGSGAMHGSAAVPVPPPHRPASPELVEPERASLEAAPVQRRAPSERHAHPHRLCLCRGTTCISVGTPGLCVLRGHGAPGCSARKAHVRQLCWRCARQISLYAQPVAPVLCSDEEAPRKEKDRKRKHKRSKKKRRDRSVAASDDDEAPRKKHRR